MPRVPMGIVQYVATMPRPLERLRVAITEHRSTSQLHQLLERIGAEVLAYPLLKETPIENEEGARDFIALCETTRVDYIVFYTGVGVDFLFRGEKRPELMACSKVIARGPKSVAALKRAGVRV